MSLSSWSSDRFQGDLYGPGSQTWLKDTTIDEVKEVLEKAINEGQSMDCSVVASSADLPSPDSMDEILSFLRDHEELTSVALTPTGVNLTTLGGKNVKVFLVFGGLLFNESFAEKTVSADVDAVVEQEDVPSSDSSSCSTAGSMLENVTNGGMTQELGVFFDECYDQNESDFGESAESDGISVPDVPEWK